MYVLQRFSTGEVQPAERVHFWNQLLNSRLGPFSLQPLSTADYTGSLACFSIGRFELLQANSSPALVFSQEVGRDCDVLNLALQTRGRTTNTSAGSTSTLNPMDLVLYDPSQPLRSRFTEPNQTLVLRVPRWQAQDRLPHLSRMIGQPVQGHTGGPALLANFLRTMWEQLTTTADSAWADSLDDVIWSLLSVAYASQAASEPELGRREKKRSAILAFVDKNLARSDLDARQIADAVGVSARYVQALFAEMATTPSAFILNLRLEFVARQIKLHRGAVSITELAYDAGFNNLSSFCRAFRRKFGVSSREFR